MLNSEFIKYIAKKYPQECMVYGRTIKDSSMHIIAFMPRKNTFKVYFDGDGSTDLIISASVVNKEYDLLEVVNGYDAFVTTKLIEESRIYKSLTRLGKVYTSVHGSYWGKGLKVGCVVDGIGNCIVRGISCVTEANPSYNSGGYAYANALRKAQIKLVSVETGKEYVVEGAKLKLTMDCITVLRSDGSVAVNVTGQNVT